MRLHGGSGCIAWQVSDLKSVALLFGGQGYFAVCFSFYPMAGDSIIWLHRTKNVTGLGILAMYFHDMSPPHAKALDDDVVARILTRTTWKRLFENPCSDMFAIKMP